MSHLTIAPTFDSSVSENALDILAEYGPDSAVIIWREAGESRAAWSASPATIAALSESKPSKMVAATVYWSNADLEWTSSPLVTFARLFPDDPPSEAEKARNRTVSPIFGVFVPSEIGRFEPWRPLARAWHSERDETSPLIRLARFYQRGRLPMFGDRPSAVASVAYGRQCSASSAATPYATSRRPMASHGSAFALGRGSSSMGQWIECPSALGFRFVDTAASLLGERSKGWYLDDDTAADTAEGVVLAFHGFRVPAIRYSYESTALTIGVPRSRMWESVADLGEEEANREAARTADHLAEIVAECERDYQEVWRAGTRVADAEGELKDGRAEVRKIFRGLAAARRTTDFETWRGFVRPLARAKAADVFDEAARLSAEIERLRDRFDGEEGFRDGLEV